MSFAHDSVTSPSVQDLHCDSRTGGFGFADEQPADEPRHEYTAEEEEQIHQQHLARLAEDDRCFADVLAAFKPLADAAEATRRKLTGWHETVCAGCSVALLVQDGTGDFALCSRCAVLSALDEVDDGDDDQDDEQQIQQLVLHNDVAE